jgi:hypothetical protein
MSIYYTYLLHHIPTNTYYYGVRWAKGCNPEEFWKTYFTSSKTKVPELREQYGDDSFEYEIRKTFDNKEKAIDWENKVLRRMKVLNKPEKWLNRTNNKSISEEKAFRWTGIKRPKQSEIMKNHFMNGKNPNPKGNKQPEKTKLKISNSLIGNSFKKGKKEKEETKQKKKMMHKGKKFITDGRTVRMIQANIELPDGFVYGKKLKN